MFFLVLSYSISTTLLQILISLQFPIHSSKCVHWCSRKRPFEFSEASAHWCFEKLTAPKIPAYFLAKHPRWSLFKYTCRSSWNFPKSCLEQLFCREPFSAFFCKKELHRQRNFSNFPALKNVEGKAGNCNLKTCN